MLKRVGTVLKYMKLAGLRVAQEWDEQIAEALGDFQETLNEMVEDFEKVADKGDAPALLEWDIDDRVRQSHEKHVAGAALREFRALLEKLDESRHWHGLVKKKWDQTGEYLWVCDRHATLNDYK